MFPHTQQRFLVISFRENPMSDNNFRKHFTFFGYRIFPKTDCRKSKVFAEVVIGYQFSQKSDSRTHFRKHRIGNIVFTIFQLSGKSEI
jgi:hypothetical protein